MKQGVRITILASSISYENDPVSLCNDVMGHKCCYSFFGLLWDMHGMKIGVCLNLGDTESGLRRTRSPGHG